MKLGIIGAGAIVREFLPDLQTLPGLEAVVVQGTPRSAEKTAALCAEHGVPHAVQDLESLLALGPDLVYIAAPNHLHFPLAMQVLERGLPAVVEKPLAGTFAQAQALAEQARRHAATVWEAITTPYLPTYQKLREWLPRVDAVRRVECDFCQYSRRYDAFLAGQTPPVFDPAKEGGALMDLNVYNLHFALGLFGTPQSAAYAPELERGIDTAGTLTLEYPGFTARLTAAKSRSAPPRFVVEGTGGTLACQYPPNRIGAVTFTAADGQTETFDDGSAAHRVLPEFAAITAAIAAGDTALYQERLAQSLEAARILTAARTAAGIRFPSDDAQ